MDLLNLQITEVIGRFAQVGASLVDVANQQVGNSHARVRRLGLITHEGDAVVGRMLANGFGGNHASRASAKNDVMGHGVYRPRRFLVSAVGRPSLSQPRAW